MKLQQLIPLSNIYTQEEDFSTDLADNLDALQVGDFEDPETESNVGTRRADIVAAGEDGILVIENQFGKADWDHWGRLEAYARLKKADVAVLVAEEFEELMIVTCNLRNEDSAISWYLIQAQANAHKELSFHHIARPAIDIQTEKKAEVGYSEFWAPIPWWGWTICRKTCTYTGRWLYLKVYPWCRCIPPSYQPPMLYSIMDSRGKTDWNAETKLRNYLENQITNTKIKTRRCSRR